MQIIHGPSPPGPACEEIHEPGPQQRAGFFDLDKTLLPGSSLFRLAQGLHERHFYGGDDMVRFAWRQLTFRLASAERAPAVESSKNAALEFVRGRHRPEVQALADEIAAERIVPDVYPTMAERIAQHRAAGDLTFVATAAPTELAEIVAQRLGMTGAFGTQAEVDETECYSGRLAGGVLDGEAKAQAVKAHATLTGIDLAASVAYSDSIRDLPLLELVGNAEVVNPDRKLREVAEARGWPVHDLKAPSSRQRNRRGDDVGGGAAPGGTVRGKSSPPVGERLAALELSVEVQPVAETGANSRSIQFTVEDPEALVRDLEESGRFRRDTRLGAMFHPGQISLREVAPSNSLHISVGEGNKVSAHIDRYSPLSANQPDTTCRYSLPRVAAHNLAGMAADIIRLIPGRRR